MHAQTTTKKQSKPKVPSKQLQYTAKTSNTEWIYSQHFTACDHAPHMTRKIFRMKKKKPLKRNNCTYLAKPGRGRRRELAIPTLHGRLGTKEHGVLVIVGVGVGVAIATVGGVVVVVFYRVMPMLAAVAGGMALSPCTHNDRVLLTFQKICSLRDPTDRWYLWSYFFENSNQPHLPTHVFFF